MTITLVATCLAVLVASVLGGIVPLATVLNHTRLQVYLSFSAGTMLGAAFFHMLPEAVRVGSAATIPWAAAGLLVLFFLERFFSFHHHERARPRDRPSRELRSSRAARAFRSCGIRRSPRGAPVPDRQRIQVALGCLRPGSPFIGWRRGAGQRRHRRFPRAWRTRGSGLRRAPRHAGAQAGRRPDDLDIDGPGRVGALARAPDQFRIWPDDPSGRRPVRDGASGFTPGAASSITAGALSFSAGTFLCIALSDLLPELQFHSHDRLKLSLALLAGVGLMGVTAFLSP